MKINHEYKLLTFFEVLDLDRNKSADYFKWVKEEFKYDANDTSKENHENYLILYWHRSIERTLHEVDEF